MGDNQEVPAYPREVQRLELDGVEVAMYLNREGEVVVEVDDTTDFPVWVYANSHCLTINNDWGDDFPWNTEKED